MAKNTYILLGCIGSLIILSGLLMFFGTSPPHLQSQLYYFVGGIALLITAIHFRLFFFIALQLILIAGHAAILLMFGKENSVFLILGVFGIALLSMGFAYNDKWIFFSGSSFIAIYAYYNAYNGLYPSYIWAVLNTAIALLAIYRILFV
ncbi:hypothetical protein [Fluoribacter gormanii]|uniref:hypothetical protein n=1 Tax=Fluoribacter gormanii TaxID=464 RepID=UPI0010416F45|nr:hypothetical protein [Fluoribacter gormanii]